MTVYATSSKGECAKLPQASRLNAGPVVLYRPLAELTSETKPFFNGKKLWENNCFDVVSLKGICELIWETLLFNYCQLIIYIYFIHHVYRTI